MVAALSSFTVPTKVNVDCRLRSSTWGLVATLFSLPCLATGINPYDTAQPVEFLHLGLRAPHRRRCVTNRPAADETATRGMSIRRNDQLIRYSPLTTVASTPKAMIRTTPIGTRKEGRSRPRIKPITRPLATGSSSTTITHHPLAVGSRTTSATKPSAPRPFAGTNRTLVSSFPSRRAIFLVDALTYTTEQCS